MMIQLLERRLDARKSCGPFACLMLFNLLLQLGMLLFQSHQVVRLRLFKSLSIAQRRLKIFDLSLERLS